MRNKIVLDTNCLLMALSKHGNYFDIWRGLKEGKYILCVSNEILAEYSEILASKASATVADNVIFALAGSEFVEYVDPHFHLELIKIDPDDNKFVDCAFAANATYIVSNDKHFDVLKSIQFPSIDVIGIDEFLEELKSM